MTGNRFLIVESIAYYGTYTINEAERVAIFRLEASTFPNQIGTELSSLSRRTN